MGIECMKSFVLMTAVALLVLVGCEAIDGWDVSWFVNDAQRAHELQVACIAGGGVWRTPQEQEGHLEFLRMYLQDMERWQEESLAWLNDQDKALGICSAR